MNQTSEEFNKVFLAWMEGLGVTRRQLYTHVEKLGKPKHWLEVRQRGKVVATHEELDWLRQMAERDISKLNNNPQYDCYDCEERMPGKPYYTMIPARGEDPGAFLCPACFDGLEEKGFKPDVIE